MAVTCPPNVATARMEWFGEARASVATSIEGVYNKIDVCIAQALQRLKQGGVYSYELTEGEDGFIVPIRDPQAVAEKLEALHRDR